jgi:predicted nucleic acid-binding protein
MGTRSRPRLVVDASVAIKWLVDEHDSWMAAQLRGADYDLYAPSLLASEVANILWKKARRGEIGREIAARSAAVAARFPLHWSNDEVLLGDAVEISLAIDHLTYDRDVPRARSSPPCHPCHRGRKTHSAGGFDGVRSHRGSASRL